MQGPSNQLYGMQLPGLYGQEALDQIDEPLTEPFLTQNFVFSITDVSPDWAYCTNETKVWLIVFSYFLSTPLSLFHGNC